jgi:phosphoglucomutase
VWTTDKDDVIAALLSVAIAARTGRDPGEIYGESDPVCGRIDVPATTEEKNEKLSSEGIRAPELRVGRLARFLPTLRATGMRLGALR